MISSNDCYITAIRLFEGGEIPPGLDAVQGIELFIVTSSAEIDIMHEPRAREVLRASTPRGYTGEIVFVSIGCAGLFASVLEFVQRPVRRCRILALEMPASFVQHTLDVASLGEDGDGFIAQDVACVMDLSKEFEGAIAKIGHCEILARRAGFGGTAKLSQELARCLENLCLGLPGANIVTFENVSLWSQRLLQLVTMMLRARDVLPPERWLPSIESDERHFMSVRPLLDILPHINETRRQRLIVACLGAGGRVGLMALEWLRVDDGETEQGRLTYEPTFGKADRHEMGEVALLGEHDAVPVRPTQVLYADREFYGRNNFYFLWTLRN
jgi:hypothetical protein